jgi:hypothetical protein
VYGVLCEGDTADGKKELTVTPQAFMSSTRSSAMEDHRGGGGQDKNSWLLTPGIGRVSKYASAVQCPLKIGILHLGVFQWTNPNGGQKLSEGLDQVQSVHRFGPVMPSEPASGLPVSRLRVLDF